MKKTFLLIFLFSSGITFCQSKDINGIVKVKSDKKPLPGVSVLIKGTKIGTQTDFDGSFKISVPDSLNILTFSFVGFQILEYKLETEKNIEIF